MNRLELKTEFPLGSDDEGVRTQSANEGASPHAAARAQTGAQAVRRRGGAARLRFRTDDGFHLFRIY